MAKLNYVVTGATSRTGSIVSKALLEAGARVRVLGRSAKRLEPLTRLGAEVRIVEPLDAEALNAAFVGVDAAYVMLQPNYIPDHPDFRGYQNTLVDNLGLALERSRVSHGLKEILRRTISGFDVPLMRVQSEKAFQTEKELERKEAEEFFRKQNNKNS